MGLFGELYFMKIPLSSPSLDQKEQKCFGHPQFYSTISPMSIRQRGGVVFEAYIMGNFTAMNIA